MSGDCDGLRDLARELLDAEAANRLHGQTIENQGRLARARRRLEEALAVEPQR